MTQRHSTSPQPRRRPASAQMRRRRRGRAIRRTAFIAAALALAVSGTAFALSQRGGAQAAPQASEAGSTALSQAEENGSGAAAVQAAASSVPGLSDLDAAQAQAMLDDPLMVLVNHTNKMPDGYIFETKECGSATSINKTLQTAACDAFLQMQAAAADDGVTIWMQSGYRSVSYQTTLYTNKTNYYINQGYDEATAKLKAANVVNPPGYSEHNCGLAADLNCPEYTGLDEGFKNTSAYTWLCAHAGEYGFILRYPEGREDVTDVIYEPWHWRYVGVENAARINSSGLIFEEYIAELQKIASGG